MSFLSKHKLLFIIWSFAAAFLAYASMYAFRKPFNAATYEGQLVWGLPLKGVLVISQIIGYMVSKFVGIKVISELTKGKRIPLILLLIGIAHLALFGFAVVPLPWKFLLLFLNGIPLGMVWGVIFSFLEGRRLTELIATGIAVGAIVASGLVKSIARILLDNTVFDVPQFWMPFAVGLLFYPCLYWRFGCFLRFPRLIQRIYAKKHDVNLYKKKNDFNCCAVSCRVLPGLCFCMLPSPYFGITEIIMP
jgi:hypothetical protein